MLLAQISHDVTPIRTSLTFYLRCYALHIYQVEVIHVLYSLVEKIGDFQVECNRLLKLISW